jgi:hypothetical protein
MPLPLRFLSRKTTKSKAAAHTTPDSVLKGLIYVAIPSAGVKFEVSGKCRMDKLPKRNLKEHILGQIETVTMAANCCSNQKGPVCNLTFGRRKRGALDCIAIHNVPFGYFIAFA